MSTFLPSIHTSSRCSLILFLPTVDIASGLWQFSPTWLSSCIWPLWQFLFSLTFHYLGFWREDIKKWQKYTEELYKEDLNDPGNHDGVSTHLEPVILGCEVNWALGSISMNKVSGGDVIPVELFQILKDDAVKVLHSICQQIWKTQKVATRLEKVGFHPNPKKGNPKECSYYRTLALNSHTSNDQNSPSQTSAIREPWTSRCLCWF